MKITEFGVSIGGYAIFKDEQGYWLCDGYEAFLMDDEKHDALNLIKKISSALEVVEDTWKKEMGDKGND